MFLNPSLDEEEIKKEKEVVFEEINMYLDQPAQHVHELFNELLWPDQPLGRMILGSPETLKKLSPQSIADYKNWSYIPPKTVIAVAGKVTHDQVIEETKRHFPSDGAKEIPTFKAVIENQKKPEAKLLEKGTEQFHLCVGLRAYPREHPHRYAQRLLSIALGENMSSRLFQEIREERGLAYDIHSSVSRYYDTGLFTVSAGLEKKKLKDALAVILKEMGKIKENLISDEELRRAKEYYIGQLVLGLEKTMNSMLWVGENFVCSDQVLTKEEVIEKIQEVDVEQIRNVAQELFTDERLNLSLIGPIKDKNDILSELHF